MSDFVPYEEWLEGLSWVQSGDCVYVVSDVFDIAKAVRAQGERFEPHKLIDKLQEMVGKEGTLLFATFNWDFCGGTPFDYYKTPVRTGALSKKALEREEFVRTKHPLYSFAVWGKDQALLEQNDSKTSFGPGTIFAYLYEKNAKVLNVGIPALKGVTYVHHVEQMVGVPYRYHKDFTGSYTDKNGVCSERTYSMYVRDLIKDPQYRGDFKPLEEQMKAEKLITPAEYYGVESSLILIRDLDMAVRRDILENDSRGLYVYNGQKP